MRAARPACRAAARWRGALGTWPAAGGPRRRGALRRWFSLYRTPGQTSATAVVEHHVK
ncbi:unnamed protein product, partial [Prorocentrum cordatum]